MNIFELARAVLQPWGVLAVNTEPSMRLHHLRDGAHDGGADDDGSDEDGADDGGAEEQKAFSKVAAALGAAFPHHCSLSRSRSCVTVREGLAEGGGDAWLDTNCVLIGVRQSTFHFFFLCPFVFLYLHICTLKGTHP